MYYSVFAADTLLYAVTLTFHPVTLTFVLWPWTFAMYRLWCDETLYQIWMHSSNPRQSYCDFNIWPNDLERRVTCYARFCDNFHRVWPSTSYPFPNYSVSDADTLSHAVTFDPLTFKDRGTSSVTRSKSVRRLSEIKQSTAELLMIFCTRYVALWPWPLTSSPWTFTELPVSCL